MQRICKYCGAEYAGGNMSRLILDALQRAYPTL